jgi:hypothetical protein
MDAWTAIATSRLLQYVRLAGIDCCSARCFAVDAAVVSDQTRDAF